MLDALLERGLHVEPGEPAEIDEDGVADQALGRRLEIAVPLEVKAQRGVGALVGPSQAAKLVGGKVELGGNAFAFLTVTGAVTVK